jgi:hypothetical protein
MMHIYLIQFLIKYVKMRTFDENVEEFNME